jgi:hypothetical protein
MRLMCGSEQNLDIEQAMMQAVMDRTRWVGLLPSGFT